MRKLPENGVRLPYREIEVNYCKQSTILAITGVKVPYRVIESILLNTKKYDPVLHL